jgi:hypothetical protein
MYNLSIHKIGDMVSLEKTNCFINCCAVLFMTENKPVDRNKASKLANMLEGLDLPADKAMIYHI